MKIPKKLKIGGHWFDVCFRKERRKDDGVDSLGSEDYRYNKIWLNGDQAQQQLESTLLHEIIEAINGLNQMEFSEHQIRVLETSLYQVLSDNHLLR